jgi:hypothetical protein
MLPEIVPQRFSTRIRRIDVLVRKRKAVFAEVERTQGTPEMQSHFASWTKLTKEIESLQSSPAE